MSRPRRLVAITVALAAFATACGTGTPPQAAAPVTCPDGASPAPPAGGDALPSADLSVLGEDATMATACWTGQPLLINFWAQWCPPCRQEMPDLQAVHQAVGDQVRFIGVDFQDQAQRALDFAAEVGVTYELVEDPDGSFFEANGGRGQPFTLLVDADGTVLYRHSGPLTEASLRQLLDEQFGVTA